MREPAAVLAGAARHAGPLLGAADAPGTSTSRRSCTRCSGPARTSPPSARSASPSTTRSGPTRPRCAGSSTSRGASTSCRSRCSSRRARASRTRRSELLDMLAAQPATPGCARAAERGRRRSRSSAARRRDGDDRVGQTVHEMAGGNPLLVREAAAIASRPRADARRSRALRPQTLGRSVLRRLDSLARAGDRAGPRGRGPRPRRDARATPRRSRRRPRRAAARRSTSSSRRACSRRAGRCAFVHPLMRSALYGSIRAGERSRAHARAARLLADAGGRPRGSSPHLLAAEPAGDAGGGRAAARRGGRRARSAPRRRPRCGARSTSRRRPTSGRACCSSSARRRCAPTSPRRSSTSSRAAAQRRPRRSS